MKYHGFKRLVKHLFSAPWLVKRYFPQSALDRIEAAIRESERLHTGEIRFAVESDLHPLHVVQGKLPRHRAIELFSQLGVWDTAANNGVLIYLLLADHDVEIVADRGIHAHLGTERWEEICHQMELQFKQGKFEAGILLGIAQISQELQRCFPASGDNPNELPDRPIVL
ncbi:MAG: TPM domain-containing protein [Methylophilaceae bacterium]